MIIEIHLVFVFDSRRWLRPLSVEKFLLNVDWAVVYFWPGEVSMKIKGFLVGLEILFGFFLFFLPIELVCLSETSSDAIDLVEYYLAFNILLLVFLLYCPWQHSIDLTWVDLQFWGLPGNSLQLFHLLCFVLYWLHRPIKHFSGDKLLVCAEAFSKSLLLFSPTQIQVSVDDGGEMAVQNQGGGLGNTIVSVYEQISLWGSE